MRSSGTNKQHYQLDRSALKMSPQMSNNRHQISNSKQENVKSLQNIDCATLNQWKAHQRPITAPLQVSQYLTQQLQNQLNSTQNHLICTCPPEVHKALLEQQLLQHQTHHQLQHATAQHLQHFQPCPHQRQTMKTVLANTNIDPHTLYALISQQQQQQAFMQHQLKTAAQAPVSTDSNIAMTLQPTTLQMPTNHPSANIQQTVSLQRQANTPETMAEARAQIAKMESQLLYLTSWIQTNWQAHLMNSSNGNFVGNDSTNVPTNPDSVGLSQPIKSCYLISSGQMSTDVRDGSAMTEATPSNSSLDSAYSAKSNNSSDINPGVSKQPITNTDFVPHLSQPFTEDAMRLDLINKLRHTKTQFQSIRQDIEAFRKWNQSIRFAFKEEINEAFLKIKRLMESSSAMNIVPVRKEREQIDNVVTLYAADVDSQMDRLEDLEVAIEDLRVNVLNRRCRVNIDEVEVLALHLSKISKDLSKNKADFSVLETNLKQIMQIESDSVKKDEKFLESEPKRVENALRLCKKLISTLFTLKRLGSVQENTGSDSIPEIRSNRDPKPKDKQAIFEGIKTILPDHEYRMQKIALSEKLRECRRRMLTSHETMKFEKSLELAAKTLKEVKLYPTSNFSTELLASPHSAHNSKESGSLSSLTDSDNDANTPRPEVQITKKDSTNQTMNESSHASSGSSDTSNDQDSSDNAASPSSCSQFRAPCSSKSSSSKVHAKHGTILKTSHHSSRSNRSSKVAFNRTVTVEGGSEVLQLNCPDDDYDEDLSSMTCTTTPPPPPPRLSSQDETVSPPETDPTVRSLGT